MIKYVIEWNERITSHECTKETEKCVWLKKTRLNGERRETKQLKGSDVFETWEEAHAELLRRAENKLQSARFALSMAQGWVGNVKEMKPPAGEVEE